MLAITVLAVLSLQQVTFASEKAKQPTKPITCIESSDLNHGSNQDNNDPTIQSTGGLFYNYYCSISNQGANLYLEGTTASNYLSDQVSLTRLSAK